MRRTIVPYLSPGNAQRRGDALTSLGLQQLALIFWNICQTPRSLDEPERDNGPTVYGERRRENEGQISEVFWLGFFVGVLLSSLQSSCCAV